MIARSGGRIPPLTIAALGTGLDTRETLPPIKALFGPGQLRWTLIGLHDSEMTGGESRAGALSPTRPYAPV